MHKFFKFFSNNYLLILIILLAAALRLYGISQYPPSLNWDEISHGYNAYSILKTGKDEWGATLPVIFRAYGDYKLPAYIYLTAISEALFGLNPFSVRLVSVLAGILTVFFTYLLTRKLFGQKPAIVASFLVAVEQWTFFLSRGAFEANLCIFFIVAGVYFFLKSINSAKYLVLSIIFLGLSVWTYNSARIFVPLLLIVLFLIYRKELILLFRKSKKLMIIDCLLLVIFLAPMLFQLLNPAGQARYGKVAIIDEGAIAKINQDRNSSKIAPVISKIIYNKGTYFTVNFAKNWFSYFSPEFLFLKGGSQYQFSIPNHGLIFLVNIPFFLLGIIFLIRKKTKESFLVLSWFLIAPIPGSLTREAPHVLRAITMLPVPMMLTAIGLLFFLDKIPGKFKLATILIYSTIIFALLGSYLKIYFLNYARDYSWSWQYGYKEAVNYIKENYSKYDEIIITKKYGEPHEFLLFYWPWDPDKFRNNQNLIRFFQSDWYWIDRFDKFYFVNDWQIKDLITESKIKIDCQKSKCLLITSPANYPNGWKKLETINFLDGKADFEIYENN